MADYAGAVAAIKQRMIDNWTTTPIVFQNENLYDPSSDATRPWVYFEVIGNGSSRRGPGMPGHVEYLYLGLIAAHVFVPVNSGAELAQQYAVSIGEIFRSKEFYNDAPNAVRTWTPQTDGGGSDADDANWWRVTVTVNFEFLYRG